MRLRPSFLFAATLSFLLAASTYGSITGTVIDADGKAVSGATISAFTPETAEARRIRYVSAAPQRVPLATATTDSNGRFTIDDGKQPMVEIRVEAKGFAPDSARYVPGEDAGAIALTPAATKSGTITAKGKPVAGATVIWTGDAELVTTTDEKGKYSIPDPDKWASRILIHHPDYAPLEIVLAPFNDAKKSLDRTLDGGVAIKGRVVAADGTTAAPKVAVFVDNWPLAASGDDGTFMIAHAAKDWVQVEVRAGDRAAARAHTNGELTLKLAKGGVVTGVVRDLASQQPLPGTEVRLITGNAGSAVVARVAFSDAKGNYTLSPVVAGMYQLTVARPNAAMPPAQVGITAGQVLQKPLYLTERGRVGGMVVDENKQPVSGAHITARAAGREGGMMMIGRQGQAATAFSGPDGRFALRGAETASDLVLEAQKRSLPLAKTAAMRLQPGERKSGVVITIPHGLTLSGKVLDHDKRPLSGVTVDAAEASNDMAAAMTRRVMINLGRSNDDQFVRTSSDGSFSMKLKEGTYDLTFKREGFAAKNVRGQAVNASVQPLEIVLDPGVEISGRVSRAGAPVEGVNVSAIGENGLATTQSLPDGTFRIGDLTPGSLMLSVNKQDAMIQTMRSVTAPAHDVNIELPAGGRISGRVVDKTSHQPVPNFQAGVSMPRGGGGMVIALPPMMRVFTSDDGTFTLDNVPTGQVELLVNAPNYTAGRVPGLVVEDGKLLENVEVALDSGVKLTGRVTAPDGSPLSGVSVRPDMAAAGGRVMRANFGPGGESASITDPNGEYTLDALEPGEKTFDFNRSGYLQEQRTITLSGKDARLDVQLSSGLRVSGSVTTDSGAPVADATVSVSSSGADFFGGRNVHSDSNGVFQFEGLAPGHYTFTAAKNGFANGISRDVDVSSGAPVRVVMKSGGIISGHVSGLTDRELNEATVQVNSQNGNATAPVDSTGFYRIEGAPTGTVRVSAMSGRFFGGGSKSSPVKSVEVDPGASVTVDLEFKSGTVIRGRVARNGKTLNGAMVVFVPKNGTSQTNASGTTDSNGQYEINGLDDGTYNVQVVDMERITPFTTSYQVKGSGNFDIDYVTASIRGRVLDASTGEPIADAHVEVKAAGSQSFFSARGAQTDGAGNFLIDNVARGSYGATAEKSGYGNETKDFSVSDSDVQVELKISPSNGVTLRVVDARDQRMLSAMVRTIDQFGHEQDPPLMRPGQAEPVKLTLAPGVYTAIITSPGYATRSLRITSPSDQMVTMSPGGTVVIHSKSGDIQRGRLIDTVTGQMYTRGPFSMPLFPIDPSPGATPLMNVAPGTYRLEVLEEKSDKIAGTTSVTVVEGQQVDISI